MIIEWVTGNVYQSQRYYSGGGISFNWMGIVEIPLALDLFKPQFKSLKQEYQFKSEKQEYQSKSLKQEGQFKWLQ